MIEGVSYDHLAVLEKDKNIRVITSTTSNQYVFRMNWLQPPFNNVKIRQAAAYALDQEEFLQANIGDKQFYRVCKAMFTCDSPLATTAGMDGLIEGNAAKARQLLQEAGYDGTLSLSRSRPISASSSSSRPSPSRSSRRPASRSRSNRWTGRAW